MSIPIDIQNASEDKITTSNVIPPISENEPKPIQMEVEQDTLSQNIQTNVKIEKIEEGKNQTSTKLTDTQDEKKCGVVRPKPAKPKKVLIQLTKRKDYQGVVEAVKFPNEGIVLLHGRRVTVNNVIPGQVVQFNLLKVGTSKCEGYLQKVIKKSDLEDVDNVCKHNDECGGCTYQSMGYPHQLKLKADQVQRVLEKKVKDFTFEGILPSPVTIGYRNRMDFTFGDRMKGGELECGLHKMGHYNSTITVDDCRIVDEDFITILKFNVDYFRRLHVDFYHKKEHKGVLRNLIVRKAMKTGEIMCVLITTTQMSIDEEQYKTALLNLKLKGTLRSIIHTLYDSQIDECGSEKDIVLYGNTYINEELLGLHFKISPLTFFQTNSLGAEVLYSKVREFIQSTPNDTVFDLYCGTGTITQILAPVCKEITGVEIVERAVEDARKNAELNKLKNCKFIAGDVLKVLDSLKEQKPGLIVVDPPRGGINPKALQKIVEFGAERIVYVSCMPTTLVRDLEKMESSGYKLQKVCCVDMFPNTYHVETVCLLNKQK
ncbi:RNA m5u methyltransferase, putative [Entamoeba invadens IP1]|uniref:RNA m5u methyltransferase, putative n=1 Tax=Entamoeba invadens IP1 TaxID=370355 RepID=A0A0A1U2J0_ENTIV|nr:RNA m5u methyltransferase, putative [Entamoeba invadens IP1]ELP86853.1 RNA m5u methyltransferase, putative [Entamoeba invadens IP1]|eukprot:XP_004253624.1 RNA m5u methyltransferase, putative [Entamoeba invadens IP1]